MKRGATLHLHNNEDGAKRRLLHVSSHPSNASSGAATTTTATTESERESERKKIAVDAAGAPASSSSADAMASKNTPRHALKVTVEHERPPDHKIALRWFKERMMYFDDPIECELFDFVDYKLAVVIHRNSSIKQLFVQQNAKYEQHNMMMTADDIMVWIESVCTQEVLTSLVNNNGRGQLSGHYDEEPFGEDAPRCLSLERKMIKSLQEKSSVVIQAYLKTLLFKLCADLVHLPCGLYRTDDNILIVLRTAILSFYRQDLTQMVPSVDVWSQSRELIPKSLQIYTNIEIYIDHDDAHHHSASSRRCFTHAALWDANRQCWSNDRIFVKQFPETSASTQNEISLWLQLPKFAYAAQLILYRRKASSKASPSPSSTPVLLTDAVKPLFPSKLVSLCLKPCLVFRARHGSLEDLLRLDLFKNGVNAKLCLFVFLKCVVAVDYLHIHRIAHLDLKPSNFLADINMTVKADDPDYIQIEVTDLGHSTGFIPGTSNLVYQKQATAYYQAPEQYLCPLKHLRDVCCQEEIRPVCIPASIPGQQSRGTQNINEVRAKMENPLNVMLCKCVRTDCPCPCIKAKHRMDGEKCDVYGLGGILFRMMVGHSPWGKEWNAYQEEHKKLADSDRNEFLFHEVVMKQRLPPFPITNKFPAALIALMMDCLHFHPAKRPSIVLLKQRVISLF